MPLFENQRNANLKVKVLNKLFFQQNINLQIAFHEWKDHVQQTKIKE